ncbi:HlyD family efflux transporter periplasmic adaptor subunit, partial [Bacteroides acidifaciens]|uniref:HlyD family efflux transporter periplasmic adaptor subunit n=1 Tax=Bacteroides acidifaciens TaxID=85831 RepID=UPI003015636F
PTRRSSDLRNQILAVIKNSANVDDVLWLKLVMDSISTEQYKKVIDIFEKKKNLELGDLTNSFSVLQKAIESYDIFCRLKTYEKKQQALLKEIQHTASYEQSLIKKYELENANCDIAAQAFKRDSTLFVGNAATMIEYEQAKSLLIQKKVSLMTNIAEIENIRIQKSQLSHALIENTDQSIEKENLLIKDMETAFKNMRTELNQWIQNFAIVAPYEGKASFSKYWSIGQYVTPGEEVMTIIPVENQLVGKLLLPTAKSGKVKIGQKVSIKLDSYPYMEFGLVQGIVQAISLMPYEKNYLVDVSLPHGLRTNYGKTLQFSQEMPGTADIITEEMTLFDRIYNPIRSILVNIKK